MCIDKSSYIEQLKTGDYKICIKSPLGQENDDRIIILLSYAFFIFSSTYVSKSDPHNLFRKIFIFSGDKYTNQYGSTSLKNFLKFYRLQIDYINPTKYFFIHHMIPDKSQQKYLK